MNREPLLFHLMLKQGITMSGLQEMQVEPCSALLPFYLHMMA